MILYITLLAIIALAVVATIYLKRAGDRSWRRHQRRAAIARLGAQLSVNLVVSTAAFSAGMKQAVQAAAAYDHAMSRLRATLSQERDQ